MKLKTGILAAAATACAVTAYATPSAKAVYDSDTKTFTFYYDEMSHEGDEVRVYNIGKGYAPTWYDNSTRVSLVPDTTNVVFDSSFAQFKPSTCSLWFNGMANVQTFCGLENLDTSDATSMQAMFCGCKACATVDLSHFNTANVTDMSSMFYSSPKMANLDFSTFDTSKVTTFRRFLRGTAVKGVLDISTFDTSSTANMEEMFNGVKVTTIYVSDKFVTTKVTVSSSMFSNCSSLVGGKGTSYNKDNPSDLTYAHVDDAPGNPGYFTLKVLEIPPTIENVTVSGISQSKATVAVSGDDLKGGEVSVELRVDEAVVASQKKDDFGEFPFTGLAMSTTYAVRVVATNKYGAVTNDTCTFKTPAPAGENWEYDADAGSISWGGWTFAVTVKEGTTEMTVGAVQAWPEQIAPLDFSRTVVGGGTVYTIVTLNPQFGHQDKASDYAPAGYEPQCLRVGLLTLPGEGLQTIGVGAFAMCVNATGVVTLPATLTAICNPGSNGSSVFADCANLTVSGAFPAGLTKIGQYAFRGVNIQGDLVITSAVLVADSAFQDSTVGNVAFGPNLTTIGGNYSRGAFQGCTQLTNMTFDAESSFEIANGYTFKGCTGLMEIDFKGLKTLKLSNATSKSNYSHFDGCTNLKRINFGSKIETVWTNAIAGVKNLEEVVFEGVPPTDMQLPLFSTYSGAKTITTRVHRKLASVTNANGVAWTDYAANGKIEHKRTTWAADCAGVENLSRRPLLTIEKAGFVVLLR